MLDRLMHHGYGVHHTVPGRVGGEMEQQWCCGLSLDGNRASHSLGFVTVHGKTALPWVYAGGVYAMQGKTALPVLFETEMVLPLTLTNHNYHETGCRV